MTSSGARISGLREYRNALKAAGADFPKELRRTHKMIADDVAMRSRMRAMSMGGIHAKAAPTIKGRGGQLTATIAVTGMGGLGNVAFWGVKRRLGWYAAARYQNSTDQGMPDWVGSAWSVGVRGQGPYAINETIARYLPELDEHYLDMLDDLARRAYPER